MFALSVSIRKVRSDQALYPLSTCPKGRHEKGLNSPLMTSVLPALIPRYQKGTLVRQRVVSHVRSKTLLASQPILLHLTMCLQWLEIHRISVLHRDLSRWALIMRRCQSIVTIQQTSVRR